jgi:hypothetical protein
MRPNYQRDDVRASHSEFPDRSFDIFIHENKDWFKVAVGGAIHAKTARSVEQIMAVSA